MEILIRVDHFDYETKSYIPTAIITLENNDDVEFLCEEAYRLTQNIFGSWSRGPMFEDGTVNEDYDSRVDRIAPLHEENGQLYGLRSSMMGDHFITPFGIYECKMIGFEAI